LQAEPAFDSPAAAPPTAERDLSISFYYLTPTEEIITVALYFYRKIVAQL